MKYKNKRGLSPVIATILLILVTIAMISIIARVVIEFAKKEPQKAKQCFETINQLSIEAEKGYACFYEKAERGGNKTVKVTIHKGDIEISKIKIAVFGGGDSESFDIEDLPGKGEERTYVLDTEMGNVEKVMVFPVLSTGDLCKETDEADLVACE